ncbi:MAG: metallophosphoesterase [Cardiobacteriaceae bacterium]|nr:metallophosphoesterase [Cardiobacteriaceae bacterium]
MRHLVFSIPIFTAFLILSVIFIANIYWIFGKKASKVVLFFTIFVSLFIILAAFFRLYYASFALLAISLTLVWLAFLPIIFIRLLNKISAYKFEKILRFTLLFLILAIYSYSWFNAHSPQVIRYQIAIDKPLQNNTKILVASDLHLGNQVGKKMLKKLLNIIDKEEPDLILMPGDIINDRAEIYQKRNYQEEFSQIFAREGVFLSLGNHEFYGNIKNNIEVLNKTDKTLLIDEGKLTNSGDFLIIGRDDWSNKKRLTVEKLLEKYNLQNKIVIILDHQPREVEKIANFPVDIVVAGHTHKGQIFPANLIVRKIYGNYYYGYTKIKNTHSFTTSGFGFWGSPFRTASRSEVFLIELQGKH